MLYILLIAIIIGLWLKLRQTLKTIDTLQHKYNSLYNDGLYWYNQALDLADYIEEITGIYVLEDKRA
jgi:uncharacterized protein YaaR (DUF327 family)